MGWTSRPKSIFWPKIGHTIQKRVISFRSILPLITQQVLQVDSDYYTLSRDRRNQPPYLPAHLLAWESDAFAVARQHPFEGVALQQRYRFHLLLPGMPAHIA